MLKECTDVTAVDYKLLVFSKREFVFRGDVCIEQLVHVILSASTSSFSLSTEASP